MLLLLAAVPPSLTPVDHMETSFISSPARTHAHGVRYLDIYWPDTERFGMDEHCLPVGGLLRLVYQFLFERAR